MAAGNSDKVSMVDQVEQSENRHELNPLTMSREELLRNLQGASEMIRDYNGLLEGFSSSGSLSPDTKSVLENHQIRVRNSDNPLNQLTPIGHLLRYLLARIRSPRLTFRLPGGGAQFQWPEHTETPASVARAEGSELTDLSQHLSRIQPMLDGMMMQVTSGLKDNEIFKKPPFQMLASSLASLCKAVIRQDWADVELCLNHINMVTTSNQGKALDEHIGGIVRSIYQSLQELSGVYPVDQLSTSAKEIPDAVENMHRVISELEKSANQNLDMLEKLNDQSSYDVGQARESVEVLADCSESLKRMQKSHPESSVLIKELRTVLTEEILVPLMDFQGVMEEFQATYLSLLSNQSFQDLTGQTMKKVIAFIESLQYQLVQVVAKNSGQAAKIAAPPRDTSEEMGPDGTNRLSQDRVDNLLAESGF